MARATVADVQAILPTSTQLTSDQIQAAIDAATCMVDQIALDCASHLSADCLAKVETYLAAHIAACTENSLSLSSETDACTGSRAVYGFKFGNGLMGTPFGQTANMLSNGCLVELQKRPVNIHILGTIGD